LVGDIENKQVGRHMHNERLTLKCILKRQDERGWIGTSGWVMNLHVPYDAVN
jgi:hypothetical protein